MANASHVIQASSVDGTTNTFNIPFSYISEDHLAFYVDNVLTTDSSSLYTATVLTGGTTVQIVKTSDSSNPDNVTIKIERNTPISSATVVFSNSSTLKASDLNTSNTQWLYAVQEAADDAADAIRLDNSSLYDANSTRIINVADPTAAQDAATKNYLENSWLSTADKAALTTVNANISNINSVNSNSTNINTLAAKNTELGTLGALGTEIGNLGTADAVSDMNTLATADIVADMNVLATADIVADMNTLGTADVVQDLNTLGTADVVADMNTLGTTDVVNNMATLAPISSNVTTVAGISSDVTTVAGVSSNVTTVAGISSDVSAVGNVATEVSRLGTADAVADMAILGTADVVTDMNVLGTADVVADLNTLGTADVVSDMNTLGTGANVTNMATVATNIAGVNSFAERYRVEASDPTGSLDEGDLYYNTTTNTLRFYNGTSWADTVATSQVTSVAVTGADGVSVTSGSPITTSGTIALSGTGLTPRTGATGSANIPSGTTAERDGSPAVGYFRYNSTTNEFEGYAGASPAWGSIGGGAGYFKGDNGTVGSSAADIFRVNEAELNTSTTISASENASATGPITVASGVTLTVEGVLAII